MADRPASMGPVVRTIGAIAMACAVVAPARAQLIHKELPEPAQGIDVQERLGASIPSPLMVRDSTGLAVDLNDFLKDDKPAILVLGYYTCPLICPLTFETLVKALNGVDYTAGEDFRVLAVSFDSSNTVEHAAEKKALALASYERAITGEVERGFVFSVASESNAARLAEAVGYHYKRLENGEYSHPVALVVLTPQGAVSRYIYSFDYSPKDLKLALLEATEGRIGRSIGDMFLHFCFAWNPREGAFTLQAMRLMQVCAVATMLLLGGLIGGLMLVGRIRRVRARADMEAAGGVRVPRRGSTARATGVAS